MELFLNLFWLTLAVPAVWLWRRDPARSDTTQPWGWIRPLMLLVCVLVLLFPVVSATDDLHMLQSEMDEPGLSKRVVRPCAGERSSLRLIGRDAPLVQVFRVSLPRTGNEWDPVLNLQVALPEPVRAHASGWRAPPNPKVGLT
jgi:hypothetical protein